MPDRRIIVDTGPLVAFLEREEPDHVWAVGQFKALTPPFFTCESVLTEASYLTSKYRQGRERFCKLLVSGLLVPDFAISEHVDELAQLMLKYRDLPISLADACLVRMTEIVPNAAVLTMDRHFKVYRRNGRQAIPLIAPPDRR